LWTAISTPDGLLKKLASWAGKYRPGHGDIVLRGEIELHQRQPGIPVEYPQSRQGLPAQIMEILTKRRLNSACRWTAGWQPNARATCERSTARFTVSRRPPDENE
jgi:hypothetical protein